jgi:hypothetical protein
VRVWSETNANEVGTLKRSAVNISSKDVNLFKVFLTTENKNMAKGRTFIQNDYPEHVTFCCTSTCSLFRQMLQESYLAAIAEPFKAPC